MAVLDEFIAERDEIVDLSVICNPNGTVLIGHWLVAGRRKVKDAEPVIAQRTALCRVLACVDPSAAIIRPTVTDTTQHLIEKPRIRCARHACNTTHDDSVYRAGR